MSARLIRAARDAGVDVSPLLSIVGWPTMEPPGPDERVPLESHIRLWEAVGDSAVPHDFGLWLGEGAGLDDLGVLGLLMADSATLGGAFGHHARLRRLLFDLPVPPIRVEQIRIVVEYDLPSRLAAIGHVAETGLAFWLTITRELVGSRVAASHVELPQAAPRGFSRHREVFGVAPVFGAPRPRLELPVELWRHPVRSAPPRLAGLLAARAEQLLRRLPGGTDVVRRVRDYLMVGLQQGRPRNIAGASKQLAMSTRTLQRRLRAAGTSYETLLDETRRELALTLLADRHLSIGEVAVVVGYSEPATFYRAFRRWTGTTPLAARSETLAPGANSSRRGQ